MYGILHNPKERRKISLCIIVIVCGSTLKDWMDYITMLITFSSFTTVKRFFIFIVVLSYQCIMYILRITYEKRYMSLKVHFSFMCGNFVTSKKSKYICYNKYNFNFLFACKKIYLLNVISCTRQWKKLLEIHIN